MSISHRIAAVAVGITIAGLTMGAAPAQADPGRGPGQCEFGGCQGPGERGPGGPAADRRDADPADWRGGPGRGPGGPQWRDDRGWRPGLPPRDLGWRGIDQGRWDHQPFNYGGHWVTPVFDPGYRAWGFWLFGVWIPL